MATDTVSIVAAGHSRFGKLNDSTLEDLIVQVTREALIDAAIDASEIDAIFLAGPAG
jgi:acetyl-CoA C-acetyltransferase